MTISKENMSRKRKNDILLIGVLLAVICLSGLLLFLFAKAGDTVIVTVSNRVYGEFSLAEDRVVEIRAENALNILVIENGKAYIREASCPDGICCAHHPISLNGESIICLPNQVVVKIKANSEDSPDIVA